MQIIKAGLIATTLMMVGCATQSEPTLQKEAPQSSVEQKAAQQAVLDEVPLKPILKRKIALGRITNESKYGQSLLRTDAGDPLGKQVADILSKQLTESGAYLVFERPDIGQLEAESERSGKELAIIGVDALLVGSLTEFGRKNVGERGFLSDTRKQIAFAKVDLRLVDTSTGLLIYSVSGAGEASTESGSVFGFGSRAGYDGTLNDGAIRQAISDAVNGLAFGLKDRKWQSTVLKLNANQVFISGGAAQGVRPGMQFTVSTAGEEITSGQTGAKIRLPGSQLAVVEVLSVFGDTPLNQGAVTRIVSGSLDGYAADQLVINLSEAAS